MYELQHNANKGTRKQTAKLIISSASFQVTVRAYKGALTAITLKDKVTSEDLLFAEAFTLNTTGTMLQLKSFATEHRLNDHHLYYFVDFSAFLSHSLIITQSIHPFHAHDLIIHIAISISSPQNLQVLVIELPLPCAWNGNGISITNTCRF